MVRRCLVVLVMASALAGCTAATPGAVSRGITSGSRHGARAVAHPSTTVGSPTTIAPSTTAPTTTSTAPSATTTSPVTTTTVPGTEQAVYEPFSGGQLAAGLSVVRSDSGTCDPYGGAPGSRTYYRCFGTSTVGGVTTVYDPCFADPSSASAPLACPVDPVDGQVVTFRATTMDAAGPPAAVSHPWAMQLASSQLCSFVSGAWGGLGPYGCKASNGGASVADCHEPVAARPWWTAQCQTSETDQSPFSAQQVDEVWF